MRSLLVANLVMTGVLLGPAFAAEMFTFGTEHLVVDSNGALLNGKKISCAELSNIAFENGGGIVFDEHCVKTVIRTVPVDARSQKEHYTNGQWLYRMPDVPVAAFIDWQYSRILFRVTCGIGPALNLIYYGDGATKLKRDDAITLVVDKRPIKLNVVSVHEGMFGSITLTPALKTLIAAAKVINIDAPNEKGVPWYTGGAPALKRLVKACN